MKAYESKLIESISKIESIESSSRKVKDTYVENHKMLSDISLEQDQILKELSVIDSELEIILQSTGQDSGSLSMMFKDPNQARMPMNRSDIFSKAQDIGNNVKGLS